MRFAEEIESDQREDLCSRVEYIQNLRFIELFCASGYDIAMSEERIITATIITTGEKNDGKQLENLIEKMELSNQLGLIWTAQEYQTKICNLLRDNR